MPDSSEVASAMQQFLSNAVMKQEAISDTRLGRVVESVLRKLPRPAQAVASR